MELATNADLVSPTYSRGMLSTTRLICGRLTGVIARNAPRAHTASSSTGTPWRLLAVRTIAITNASIEAVNSFPEEGCIIVVAMFKEDRLEQS